MVDPRIRNEKRRWQSCREAMQKLVNDDGALLELALNNIVTWQAHQTCHRWYIQRWRDLLAMPPDNARRLVLAETDEATALRQNHPFAGFFSDTERESLRRAALE